MRPVLTHKLCDLAQLVPPESVVESQADGVEPELSLILRRLDVNVWRLLTLVAEKVEAKAAHAQHRRHESILEVAHSKGKHQQSCLRAFEQCVSDGNEA